MKRNAGIYLIIVSVAVTTIGGILKIQHANGADFLLGAGIISIIIGIGLLLYKLFDKRSVWENITSINK